jgi:hypothetical protein
MLRWSIFAVLSIVYYLLNRTESRAFGEGVCGTDALAGPALHTK